jgi:hypothetical protein
MLNIQALREELVQYISDSVPLPVYRGAVPSEDNLQYTNGTLIPYAVVNFSNLIPSQNERSFIGARGDNYAFVFRVYTISRDVTICENWQTRFDDLLIGYKPTDSGEVNKQYGGSIYTLMTERAGIEAFATTSTYSFHTQLMDVTPPTNGS